MTDLLRHDGVAVRLVSAGLWLLVVTGPVLGSASLLLVLSSKGPVTNTRDTLPVPVAALAELAVLAHISGVPLQPTRLIPAAASLRQAPLADVDGRDSAREDVLDTSLGRPPLGAASVGHEPAGPDRFGVQVLVVDRTGQVETWQVTVNDTTDGPSVEGLPALVPSSDAPPAPPLGIDALQQPTQGNALAVTVEGFLRGLLIGDVDVRRYTPAGYTSPRESSRPSGDAAVTEVVLNRVGVQQVGSGVAVLAEVRVRREDGRRHVVQYPLLMAQDQGRWEVTRLLPALPLLPSANQTP